VISAATPRRRASFFFWLALAAAIHACGFALYWFLRPIFEIKTGTTETVSETTTIEIERRPTPRPSAPLPERRPHRQVVTVPPPAAAAAPRHELARQSPTAPPQPPRRPTPVNGIARDEASFSKEVAQLNKADDPHAIPTIDPATQGSSVKSYTFLPSTSGGSAGNGYIYPTTRWRAHGLNCYYGRYTYTYPDGSEEEGDIAWPFCYQPESDPFRLPPHPMPFPLPLAGFVLPEGTQLPPLEKKVYEEWVSGN